jgi:hypothetical protein
VCGTVECAGEVLHDATATACGRSRVIDSVIRAPGSDASVDLMSRRVDR